MKDVSEILKEAGCLQEGHFRLTSGRHSDKYMQCAKLFQDSRYAEPLCALLANKFEQKRIDVVIGPAIGAIAMAYEMARILKVRNIFAERENGVMTLRRNFYIEEGERVLVVEDVVTTGGSVKEVIELVKTLGGVVVGVGCIVDRSGGNVDFGTNFESAYQANITSYEPDECPLCMQNFPLIKPGSRVT